MSPNGCDLKQVASDYRIEIPFVAFVPVVWYTCAAEGIKEGMHERKVKKKKEKKVWIYVSTSGLIHFQGGS